MTDEMSDNLSKSLLNVLGILQTIEEFLKYKQNKALDSDILYNTLATLRKQVIELPLKPYPNMSFNSDIINMSNTAKAFIEQFLSLHIEDKEVKKILSAIKLIK